jgi:hypothetical protein
MGTVTPTIPRALASAAGLKLTDNGRLLDGDTVIRRVTFSNGEIK